MTIKQHAQILCANARDTMRTWALIYRRAAASGDLARMTKALIFAALSRDIARGFLEAA